MNNIVWCTTFIVHLARRWGNPTKKSIWHGFLRSYSPLLFIFIKLTLDCTKNRSKSLSEQFQLLPILSHFSGLWCAIVGPFYIMDFRWWELWKSSIEIQSDYVRHLATVQMNISLNVLRRRRPSETISGEHRCIRFVHANEMCDEAHIIIYERRWLFH